MNEDFLSVPFPNDDPYLAEWMYKRVIKQINDFEKSLSPELQAGGRLISSNNITFNIDDVSFHNPDMIIFHGHLKNGEVLRLLQHTSQLNLLLVAVPRTDDLSKPRRKIGFQAD